MLQTKNVLDEMDIAFIAGAVASKGHQEELREIREKSKKLVALCACDSDGHQAVGAMDGGPISRYDAVRIYRGGKVAEYARPNWEEYAGVCFTHEVPEVPCPACLAAHDLAVLLTEADRALLDWGDPVRYFQDFLPSDC